MKTTKGQSILASLLLACAVLLGSVSGAPAMFGGSNWDYNSKKHGSKDQYERWIRLLIKELCEHHQPSSPYKPHHRSELSDYIVYATGSHSPYEHDFCKWVRMYKPDYGHDKYDHKYGKDRYDGDPR